MSESVPTGSVVVVDGGVTAQVGGAQGGRADEELHRARRRARPGATTAMVAVSVTVWPEVVEVGEAVRLVVVLAWLTA